LTFYFAALTAVDILLRSVILLRVSVPTEKFTIAWAGRKQNFVNLLAQRLRMEKRMSVKGNPGYRVADTLGHVPRFGEVTAYSQASGLSRTSVIAGLWAGRLSVGKDDGLIYPRPAQEEPTPW
jgi:hypothetical protein